ncbi:MAG: T9SS type A sorting domain-containing protein [Bacteroidales bacterium]|nr:T9SS type A sorting domain-containing protein [Bacteroidales bacterium]
MRLITFLFAFIFTTSVNAQNRSIFAARDNFHAVLEPTGRVMNGAGQQDIASFINYRNAMKANQKPCVFMTYIGLKGLSSGWSKPVKNNILQFLPDFVIPQIGLSMTEDGNPSSHYEADVAAGLYDNEIDELIEGLRYLALPVYLRIGYEFNGTSWNGYLPSSYKQAYIYVTQKLRNANLEVATVWDASVDGDQNYIQYYPGDSVVDWWGINLFSSSDMTNSMTLKFLDSAKQHQKPVLIGESTPRYVGVLQGETSWNNWFDAYFNLIHKSSCVKMFCYINWDWSIYPQWSTWGDCRLEQNTIVSGHFTDEMDSTKYLHAQSEHNFRTFLEYIDITPPPQIQNLSSLNNAPPHLTWDAVTDASGLSHYIIYKNGNISDYSIAVDYTDENVAAGESVNYQITAMDRAGNESQISQTLPVKVSDSIEKVRNIEFDYKFSQWSTDIWGGAATFDIDSAYILSGKNSAHVKITQSSATAWHIQLRYWFQIRKDFTYIISYKAKANKSLTVETWVQMDHDPYGGYANYNDNITTAMQKFKHSFVASSNDDVYLAFMLGNIGLAEVWFDSVSVVEVAPVSTEIIESSGCGINSLSIFPNPFSKSVFINYNLAKPGELELSIYDLTGQKISTLIKENQTAGKHSIEWNPADIAEGIYFCEFTSGNYTQRKKIVMLK